VKQQDNQHWRRRIKAVRRGAGLRLIGVLGPLFLRTLRLRWKTERLQQQHWEAAIHDGSGALLALWHGRMVCGMADHAGREYTVLVSRSRDGDISEKLLQRFGYRVIRGSSSRGGASAARAMLASLGKGSKLVVTPDGPRGPRYSLNPGLVWMARETGLPILPLGFAVDRAWRLGSWDRFTIPKWGARVVLVYGEPLRVPAETDEEELSGLTEELGRRLIEAERRGFEHLKEPVDW
jgi:lysophospholipid acyltransferase (LPLAT)-like uncharacterized protein